MSVRVQQAQAGGGTPDDGSVTWAKLASSAIASVADMLAGTASKLVSAANFESFLSAGVPIQTVKTENSTPSSTTSAIPLDNTIPQNTEGADCNLDTTITPKKSDSIIRVTVTIPIVAGASSAIVTCALFKDSGADAVQVAYSGNNFGNIVLEYEEVAGSTSARTYKARYGPNAVTGYFLRSSGLLFGGIATARMTVEEIAQ